MTDQLNDAIVGCGGISRHHLTNIENTPAIRLVATMDVFEAGEKERGEEACQTA
jgi:predicted dehydrogenase|tara:strand:- start:169 stop:330 length:162 start_codon:yes stop_codon:yes gene_type:complete